jgi:uncharacterized membrane protein YjjP (DUF1212 family)
MLNKRSILIVLLILCLLFQYFEWGENTRAFAIEMMLDIFSKSRTIFHPLIVLPMFGLAGLVFSLANPRIGNRILWISIVISSILMLLTFFVALISMKLKMAISPILFITCAVILFLNQNRSKKTFV